MDTDAYTCGQCKHGAFYGQCGKCEDEYERQRKTVMPVTAKGVPMKQLNNYQDMTDIHSCGPTCVQPACIEERRHLLTDEQCNEFRAMRCSFADMIRAAYAAGREGK